MQPFVIHELLAASVTDPVVGHEKNQRVVSHTLFFKFLQISSNSLIYNLEFLRKITNIDYLFFLENVKNLTLSNCLQHF